MSILSKNLPQYRKIKEYHTVWSGREKRFTEYELDEDGVETIARNMIILNLNTDIIIKATGLSKERIEELKNEKVEV